MAKNAHIKAVEHAVLRESGDIPFDEPVSAPMRVTAKKMGRPKGSKSRMLDLAHKLYSSNGEKILRKIIDIALEDGNPNQMQALKLCADRIAPVSFFEDVAKQSGGNQINIQVNVVQPDAPAASVLSKNDEVIDVEVKEAKGV